MSPTTQHRPAKRASNTNRSQSGRFRWSRKGWNTTIDPIPIIASSAQTNRTTDALNAVNKERNVVLVTTRNLARGIPARSEEHTSELQSRVDLVCRLLLEK